MIAHPPCTYLSRAGARWWQQPERAEPAKAALEFVMTLANAPIMRIAIENPIGRLNQWWRYPDQTIQPWQFGDPYTKATCLWLKNLPPLLFDNIVDPVGPWIQANYVTRVSRQRRPMGVARDSRERSRTFEGIARAMAEQWSSDVMELAA